MNHFKQDLVVLLMMRQLDYKKDIGISKIKYKQEYKRFI